MPVDAPSPFTITETLHEGSRCNVLRGTRTADRRPVILKVLDPRGSRPRDIERLRHEYAIGKDLDLQTIVKPLSLETYEGMPALVMEDFGGTSLDHLLGAPLPIDRFLDLATRIASAVADLHERDIIHKDLKPQNILVNTDTGQVKLADFGLASRIPREHKAAESPRLIEGSLPYLAPEQTGRMNRTIDSRTDLYALGVTFYEMLTGHLPFEARDPLEWVHCHVARAPPPVSTVAPHVPELLSAIVQKLLSKMAEDRYQTARGLERDLERCAAEWTSTGALEPFPLAEHDVSDRLVIPQKLYGREAEVKALLSSFERVVDTGTPELILVSGYAGIGKSALIHELSGPVVRERGFFISGKFDQYNRDIPYSTIVQAFRELVLELLAESAEIIAWWRQRLLGALGINGQLIIDVIPQVELIIGPQPNVASLPPIEARNRFRIVFRDFIGVLARREHPLALFLDDLQWVDSASLLLLEDILTHPDARHLLVVGAYRDNEVGPAHPLTLALERMRKDGARTSDIALGPLSRERLAALVADALRSSVETVAPLADLVHDKTDGNPFFAIQFLTALHEERLIEFDGRAGAFRWDVARIHAKGFTSNVVHLMVGKLGKLPECTQEALKLLACLGNRAEVDLLAMASDRRDSEMHGVLWDAVRAGLVLRQGDAYKFLHDRVQEAAYSLVPAKQRPAMHLRIGRLLLSRLPPEAVAERVFDVVNQLNHGVALITDPAEKEVLCRLDFMAGMKAKSSVAYTSAARYLAISTALLPEDAWSARYEDTLKLHLARSECEYLAGNFEPADALFALILENARENVDRAAVYGLRMRLYQVSGRYGDAMDSAIEALCLFGFALPTSGEPLSRAIEDELRAIQESLRGRRVSDILDAPTVADPEMRAVIALLVEAEPCAYIGRPALFPLLALTATRLSLQHGNTKESCFAYSVYGLMLISVFGDIPLGSAFSETSLRLNERFEDVRLRGTLLHLHGDHINHWVRPIATDIPILEQAFRACLEVGDLVYAGFLAFETVWQLVEKGDPLDDVVGASQKFAAFARQSHNLPVYETIRLEQQFVACLKGETRGPLSFDDATFDEAECLATITRASFGCGVVFHDIMKQITAFTHEQFVEAHEAAIRAKGNLGAAMAMPIEATHYFFHALTLLALLPEATSEERSAFERTIEDARRKLELWNTHCPDNHLSRYSLVSAERARVDGRILDAERFYEMAIRAARESRFVHQEALAYELASKFYRARGLSLFADTYLREARSCYARWGADGKVQFIERQHPHLREPTRLSPTISFAARPEQFDLLSVTKASQTISSEIVLDELARTLLEVVLEQGGAQKGALLLCRDGVVALAAYAMVGEHGVETSLVPSVPADRSQRVPASIVRYVRRTKERVILSDAAAGTHRFASDEYFSRASPKSVLCMPILKQAEVVALLYLENDLLADAFTPERLTALSLIATQAAISMENALLLTKERAARAASEEAERRTAFVAEVGEILSASLDFEQTLSRLPALCVRALCDWCILDVAEGDGLRRAFFAHKDPTKRRWFDELERSFPPRSHGPHASVRVWRTGEPLVLPELTDEVLRRFIENEQHLRIVRELGSESAMIVPLTVHGEILGVLTLVSSAPGRRYGPLDLEVALEVARRAAMSIENARLYRKTQEAIQVRDEFLSVASHELNTPITSLLLTLQAMSRALGSGRSADPQSMARLVERSLRQVSRLARLNSDLLDVSRIHADRLPLEPSDVDLVALTEDVVEQQKLDLVRANCAVSIRGEGPIVGHWDGSRLEQVVTNLISNAIKFGAGKPIEINLSQTDGLARLSVADHGIGVAPAEQARIFERFERAASKNYGGMGLGLYICRKIAEAHGGSLHVKSEPGAGATFILELPTGEASSDGG